MNDFNNLEVRSFSSIEDNISKLLKKEGNTFKKQEQNIDQFNDLKNKLLDLLK